MARVAVDRQEESASSSHRCALLASVATSDRTRDDEVLPEQHRDARFVIEPGAGHRGFAGAWPIHGGVSCYRLPSAAGKGG